MYGVSNCKNAMMAFPMADDKTRRDARPCVSTHAYIRIIYGFNRKKNVISAIVTANSATHGHAFLNVFNYQTGINGFCHSDANISHDEISQEFI
jgi:hypothetical protein